MDGNVLLVSSSNIAQFCWLMDEEQKFHINEIISKFANFDQKVNLF